MDAVARRPRDAVAWRPRDAVARRPRDAVARRPRDAVAWRPRDAVARRRRPGPPAAGAGSAGSRSPTPPSPAALARRPQEPLMPDEVHQNQILREVYLKELRTQKLSTEYHVNPLRKVHTITRKPMSWHENLEEPADARFLNLIHHAAQGPWKKYPDTQTESQEIGWDSEPLVSPERDDRRLNHFRVHSDITLYKAKVWSLGEDDCHT